MSREIKFRAYHAPLGYSEPFAIGGHPLWVDEAGYTQTVSYWTVLCRIEQYTGLKDKNGVEIYEGDVVKKTSRFMGREYIGAVIYDGYYFTGEDFFFSHYDTPGQLFSEELETLEVLGNIHTLDTNT